MAQFTLRYVPRSLWPTTEYQGFVVFVYDENQVLGSWDGTGYQAIANAVSGGPATVPGQIAFNGAVMAWNGLVVGRTA